MIISASRRTDIPAFYPDWLLERLRQGQVLVRNPFNPRQVSRIALTPETVDCIVFWTKNPAPMLPLLDHIDQMGFVYYFQFTLTPYGRSLEPGVPPLVERLATFHRLADRIGPDRVLWRYDPIVFTGRFRPQDHLRWFGYLAGRLSTATRRCTISFLSLYRKCRQNLAGAGLEDFSEEARRDVIDQMRAIAAHHGLPLVGCADRFLHESCRLPPGRCVDGRLISSLVGRTLDLQRDTGQRPGCGCTLSVDIGAYDTCSHGCRYCYATTRAQAVTLNRAGHDPKGELLAGRLGSGDRVTDRAGARTNRDEPIQESPSMMVGAQVCCGRHKPPT